MFFSRDSGLDGLLPTWFRVQTCSMKPEGLAAFEFSCLPRCVNLRPPGRQANHKPPLNNSPPAGLMMIVSALM